VRVASAKGFRQPAGRGFAWNPDRSESREQGRRGQDWPVRRYRKKGGENGFFAGFRRRFRGNPPLKGPFPRSRKGFRVAAHRTLPEPKVPRSLLLPAAVEVPEETVGRPWQLWTAKRTAEPGRPTVINVGRDQRGGIILARPPPISF